MKQPARFSFFLFVIGAMLLGAALPASGAAVAEQQPTPQPIIIRVDKNPTPTPDTGPPAVPAPAEPGEDGVTVESGLEAAPPLPVDSAMVGVKPDEQPTTPLAVQLLSDEQGVTVNWVTREPTEGLILYGSDPFMLDQQVPQEKAAAALEHTVTIAAPQPGSPLYFVIVVDGLRYDDAGWPFKVYAGEGGESLSAQPAGQQENLLGEVDSSDADLTPVEVASFERILSSNVDQILDRISDGEMAVFLDEPLTPGVRVLAAGFDGHVITIDFSEELREWSENARAELVHQIDLAADQAFIAADIERPAWTEYHILVKGVALNETKTATESVQNASGIGGKRLVLNPGHGHYESGGSWPFQRVPYWGIVEDKVNVDFAIKLRDRLNGIGADLRPTRQLNKGAGNHHSGYPWWEMDASEYIRSIGAPESVWRPFGMAGVNRDIRSRPEYAKWVDADVIISIHNNGGGGTGTETWYDQSNGNQVASRRLAQLVQSKVVQRIQAEWDPHWVSRGVKGSDQYGENRWFDGPAVIVEVGFMDTQKDNNAIRDPRFQAIVADAMRDAVIEFYGGAGDSDDNRTISNGQTLQGTINPASDKDIYYFEGRRGQTATISMNKSSGSGLDSFLYLYAPDGSRIASNDDSGGNYNARLIKQLPQSGRYRIEAKSWASRSTGAYTLQLQLRNDTCATGRYKAQYYNNRYLNGSPVLTRCESSILKNWRDGSPSTTVPSDNFSVRWMGYFNFTEGEYIFTAEADDGIRVWLDGTLLINQWHDQPPTTYHAAHRVSGGRHRVKVEYYEREGGAVAKVWWERNLSCSSQYKAEYWGNISLGGSPAVTRCEGWPINHDWGGGSPGGGLPADNFSARWTGQVSINAGTYKFIARADDGIRVWLDGSLIINAWQDQSPTTHTATRSVSSGVHQIKVEYYERGGGAVAQFRWEPVQSGSGNIARGRPARASSQESSSYAPPNGNDGSSSTRWSSRISSTLGNQFWIVDLGSAKTFNRVRINWETAYAAYYIVAWSYDGRAWYYFPNSTVFTRSSPGWGDHTFPSRAARYVGVFMYTRAPRMNNFSFFEFETYGSAAQSALESPEELDMQEVVLPNQVDE